MWFSRLKTRMSQSEARSLLRRVFANCTAAKPPPTTTTLTGFTYLLLSLAWIQPRTSDFSWGSSNYCDAAGEHFDAQVQDTEPRVARISGTCEPYSK